MEFPEPVAPCQNRGGRVKNQEKCAHEEFAAEVRVGRLSEKEGGPITSYQADVKVSCVQCGVRMRFIGLAAGNHFAEPRVSVDGTELRAPLEPALHDVFQASASYTLPPPRSRAQ